MSSDTAQESASVVDSSLTEKHDMGISDDPGNKYCGFSLFVFSTYSW